MAERAIFYQLTHKFVNEERDIPESARQVIYYSLAIGHHVGVMDCLQSLMEVGLDEYREWVERMPPGPGRRKMEGVLTWGEIEINSSHAADLLPALGEALPRMTAAQAGWAGTLAGCLRKMSEEPAMYLMVRRSA